MSQLQFFAWVLQKLGGTGLDVETAGPKTNAPVSAFEVILLTPFCPDPVQIAPMAPGAS
jgi:hypothetical protein